MATQALQKVGVEAVVEGLTSFTSDVSKMNKSIASIGDQGNALTSILGGVTNFFGALGEKIIDVATYALGQLLADAIEFVVSKLGELIQNTIEAGQEFQTMELRLNRLNLNDVVDSTGTYNGAMKTAIELTKEQLNWLQKLAVQTPYDAQDIANIFTLAKSYGFASDAAQMLTKDITDFASGMGLSNTHMERIIVNFGQMIQQGKVTQREMNDLARGAFVPVNDVLERMQKDTGLAGAAFDDFKKTGEGVQAFFKAFSEITMERFNGAAQDMARTFKGATDNAQDLIKSLVGFNVVRPILDALGGKIADIINVLTEGRAWDNLNQAFANVGIAITGVLNKLFDFKIAGGEVADAVVNSVNHLAAWINEHRDRIVGFFQDVGSAIRDAAMWVRTTLIPAFVNMFNWLISHRKDFATFFGDVLINVQKVVGWMRNNLVPAFQKFGDWIASNQPLIQKFFAALGQIVSLVISKLTGGKFNTSGLDGLLNSISRFMQYVIDHQDTIATWIVNLLKLWAILQVVGAVLSFVAGIVISVGTAIISVIAFVGSLIALFTALLTPVGLLIAAFVALAATWAFLGGDAKIGFKYIGKVISDWAKNTVKTIKNWWGDVSDNFDIGVAYTTKVTANWWSQLWSNFNLGVAYTRKAIADWWTTLSANFLAGVTYTLGIITSWWSQLSANFNTGVAYLISIINTWISNVISQFNGLVGAILAIIKTLFSQMEAGFASGFSILLGIVQSMMEGLQQAFLVNWFAVGVAIIGGIVNGLLATASILYNIVKSIVSYIVNLFQPVLDVINKITSFLNSGAGSIGGGSGGSNPPGSMSAPAMVNSTVSSTNNYNLTVNSGSNVEPILQDYNMLKSMAGV